MPTSDMFRYRPQNLRLYPTGIMFDNFFIIIIIIMFRKD